MIEETYNPNDPLFLASKSLDGDLGEDERRLLNEAMRTSPALREEAKRLQTVDDLVKQWGRKGVEIDWKHHAGLVPASLQADADVEELKKVDALIAAWGRRKPVLDEKSFVNGVLLRIAPSRPKAFPLQWAWRIGAPLAAAAAIALAVTASLWFTPAPAAVVVVRIGPAGEERAVVSFARTANEKHADAMDAPEIGYMDLGSSPLPQAWDEPAPL